MLMLQLSEPPESDRQTLLHSGGNKTHRFEFLGLPVEGLQSLCASCLTLVCCGNLAQIQGFGQNLYLLV